MNLTDLSSVFKKGLYFIGGFFAIYYLVILMLIPVGISILDNLIPDRDPPTVLWGQLDQLEFVEKAVIGTPRYELNTKTGSLPSLPKKMAVYKFKPAKFSYIAGKSAIMDANSLGFSESDLITDLKGKDYKWRSLQTGGVLEINIDSRELFMNTNFTGKQQLWGTGRLSTAEAVTKTKEMFTAVGRFSDPLYIDETKAYSTTYMGKFFGDRVIETIDPAESQFVRVDLFRKLNDAKVLGPDPKKGLLHAVVAAPLDASLDQVTPGTFPIIEAYYWEVEPKSGATYPLVSVAKAWDAVRSGRGVIANVTPKGANPFEGYTSASMDTILINDISLAYYETPKAQKFLQPVYVFQGNYKAQGSQGGEITIYFPAVTGEYVVGSTEAQQ